MDSHMCWLIDMLKEREKWDCNATDCSACSHHANGGYCAESILVAITKYIEDLEDKLRVKAITCPLKLAAIEEASDHA